MKFISLIILILCVNFCGFTQNATTVINTQLPKIEPDIPSGKHARQIGVYEYSTKMGYKTVPIVSVME